MRTKRLLLENDQPFYLRRQISNSITRLTIAEIMEKAFQLVTAMRRHHKYLASNRYFAILVEDKGLIVGIIAKADLLRML